MNDVLEVELKAFIERHTPWTQGPQFVQGREVVYAVRASYEHRLAFQADACEEMIVFRWGYGLQGQIVGLALDQHMMNPYTPDDDDIGSLSTWLILANR